MAANLPQNMDENQSQFERIKRQDEEWGEHWRARDLASLLEYSDLRNFSNVIAKAMNSCENSGNSVPDHFVETTYMIPIGKGGQREVVDYLLSRYACYLIVQNADPAKEMVALGQTYFAVQTRRQELQDTNPGLTTEESLRLKIREDLREHNSKLADAAHGAGVIENKDYAIFQNHGYEGLYGGMGAKAIHQHKGLKKSQKILDHMGSTELAANLFRATQTEEKLRKEKIQGKANANSVHREVGAKVRKAIADIGGVMPEDLPTPNDSIQQLETKAKKALKPSLTD